MRRLLTVDGTGPAGPSFAAEGAWRLDPQVALRDESFGAMAYHYGTRRLVFLKSRPLVRLVTSLDRYPSAAAALDDLVPGSRRRPYERALARLAASGVISAC